MMVVCSPLSDELAPVADTSNTVNAINELCLNPHVNIVRVLVCLKESFSGNVGGLFWTGYRWGPSKVVQG
jgi:hypothetical protein